MSGLITGTKRPNAGNALFHEDSVITYVPNKFGGRLRYSRSSGATEAFWDELWNDQKASFDYSSYEKGWMPRSLRKTFLKIAVPGDRVLEAGSGMAGFSVAAAALGFQAHAVDFAPQVVEYVRTRYPDMQCEVGDVRNLPLTDGSYDVVYSPGVCEHFEEGPLAVLREAARLSRRYVIVSTPYFNPLRMWLARRGTFADAPVGEFYQWAFCDAEMRSFLRELGLAVRLFRPFGTLNALQMHWAAFRLLDAPLLVKALDELPVAHNWGHSAIWVGEKTHRAAE